MRIILNILLLILIIATLSVCFIKPDMHKNVFVYDSDYAIVPEEEVKTEVKNIPVMVKNTTPTEKVITVEKDVKSQPTQNITKTQIKQVPVKKETPKKTTATTAKTTAKTTGTSTATETAKKPVETKIVKTELPKNETKTIEKSKEITVTKVLTQQEETIAWNKWRSNLTNQIMQDTKLPQIPNGVVFQFSFTVDKFGKITNIYTSAEPSNYTPYAIQYIAPVIRSYQGRSILVFPEGTARNYTNVTGKWRISNTAKYSTENDYNDIEKIKKNNATY